MPNKFPNSMELSYNDFEQKGGSIYVKNRKKPGMILYYFDWCGHCSSFAPEWKKLAKNKKYSIYSCHGSNVAKGNDKVFEMFQIGGVPEIKYFNKDGKVENNSYGHIRNSEELVNLIENKSSISGGKKRKVLKKKSKKKVTKKKVTKKKVLKKLKK